ncbi:MAG: diguanylate cyclase [Steroidobacteraceae bacterium]|jgi:two-component system chemotaxis response regulator CheY
MQVTIDLEDTAEIVRLDLPVAPTVLLVDDDELVLAKLQEMVRAAGYHVYTATNGADALALLEKFSASIVVTDLKMPSMNGLELCRRIRAHAWPQYIYIVLLTARDDEACILAGLNAGADDYLSKRTSGAQFMARLRTAQRVLSLEYSLKDAIEKKRRLAMTDALTGVYNRRYFLRHLGRELKRAQHFGGDLSLLLLDVDHFKLVNDTFGHVVGDMVLKRLTREIAGCLQRSTDWCARLGGEEFVVVLEGTNLNGARRCAEKVRESIENLIMPTEGGAVRITVSIGISSLEGIADKAAATVQLLHEQADTNLYKSKQGGRNRVTSSHPVVIQIQSQESPRRGVTHDNTQMPMHSLR